ncbi:MAG: NUDIX domain-containing protein [Oscillospiraceae bacterium]|nr:NUDIX domain-containing protein [Oscillospiraceae bacterium]
MDISFGIENEKFNYRVCAIIIDNGRILAMKDGRSPYYYLPGGRVKIGETAEYALLRECKEELEAEPKIIRPLWLNQAFFTEDVSKIKFHEVCIYFLVDISATDILLRGDKFVLSENGEKHKFEWLSFEKLKDEYFYPEFLKKDIFNLPEVFTIRTEIEDDLVREVKEWIYSI